MNQTYVQTKNSTKLDNVELRQFRQIWLAALADSIASKSKNNSTIAINNLKQLGRIEPQELANPMTAALIHNDIGMIQSMLELKADPNIRCSKAWGEAHTKHVKINTASFNLFNALQGNISPYCFAIVDWNIDLLCAFMMAGFAPSKGVAETRLLLNSSPIAMITMSMAEDLYEKNYEAFVAEIEEAVLSALMINGKPNQTLKAQFQTIRAL